jgi:NTP pyrophosphatase (non-canonical NTP hydrolase)
MITFDELVDLVERWASDRRIVPNSTPQAQLLKTVSELGELSDATLKGDEAEVVDGVGDVLVTLIIYAKLQGLDLTHCLNSAYQTIRNRRGTLTPEGVFVKEGA